MLLHDAQRAIVQSPARFKVIVCGRGFGKTVIAVEVLGWEAMQKPNARVLYISPTYQSSRDIAWKRLKDRYGSITTKVNESLLQLTLANGSEIVLRGWESIETLRGQEFDFIVVDEVDTMRKFWVGWEEVLRPTLRISMGGVLFIGTPKGFGTLHKLSQYPGQEGFEDWRYFHYTSYDNPHLPREEIEAAQRQLTDDAFAQEYMADFRKQGNLVYPEFDDKLHVYDDTHVIPAHEFVAGIDFAYSHACAVLSIIRDTRGEYWVTKEFYRTKMTDLAIAEYVATQGYDKVYPDPAQPQGVAELRRHGVNCYEVVKSPDSVEKGVSRVREMLKRRRIHVHQSCVNTILEFRQYARDPDTGKIIKDGDDAMDALRYAIVTMETAASPAYAQAQTNRMDATRNRQRLNSTR